LARDNTSLIVAYLGGFFYGLSNRQVPKGFVSIAAIKDAVREGEMRGFLRHLRLFAWSVVLGVGQPRLSHPNTTDQVNNRRWRRNLLISPSWTASLIAAMLTKPLGTCLLLSP
ncbi:MAG: hypothetical protein ACJ8AG_23120, partial [Ktedonobacteraceae bacterium]